MARDRCPICQAAIAEGETNCPRCGARVAALPRRLPRRETGPRSERSAAARVLLRGGVGGLGLLLTCTALATVIAVARGGFIDTLGNVCGIAGASAVCASGLLGGVRVIRWGEYEQLRERARGGGAYASTPTRLSVALAGVPALVVSVVLALAH